jgi:hypothetical protein
MRLFFVNFLGVAVVLAISLSAGCSRNKTGGPNWQPDPALLDQLDTARDLGAYEMRVPKGYTQVPEPAGAPGGAKMLGWAGANRPDSTAPTVIAMLISAPAGQAEKTSPEEFLQKALDGVKRRRVNWTQTPAEGGQINGLSFLRARWSLKMHGFIYVSRDGSTFIQLNSQDIDPNHEPPLKLAETAILTFKKK